MKLKRDGYRRNRGGTSRVYDVTCGHCGEHVAFYQKDGPGALLRMYVDRFVDRPLHGEQLICGGCQSVLGSRMVYQRESRMAYRLVPGAIKKTTVR